MLLPLPLLDVELPLLLPLLEVAPPVDSRCAYGTSYWLPDTSTSLEMSYSVNKPESVVLRGWPGTFGKTLLVHFWAAKGVGGSGFWKLFPG